MGNIIIYLMSSERKGKEAIKHRFSDQRVLSESFPMNFVFPIQKDNQTWSVRMVVEFISNDIGYLPDQPFQNAESKWKELKATHR